MSLRVKEVFIALLGIIVGAMSFGLVYVFELGKLDFLSVPYDYIGDVSIADLFLFYFKLLPYFLYLVAGLVLYPIIDWFLNRSGTVNEVLKQLAIRVFLTYFPLWYYLLLPKSLVYSLIDTVGKWIIWATIALFLCPFLITFVLPIVRFRKDPNVNIPGISTWKNWGRRIKEYTKEAYASPIDKWSRKNLVLFMTLIFFSGTIPLSYYLGHMDQESQGAYPVIRACGENPEIVLSDLGDKKVLTAQLYDYQYNITRKQVCVTQ